MQLLVPVVGKILGAGAASTLQTAGTVLATGGAIAGGIAGKQMADYQAKQLEKKAGQEIATASRNVEEQARQKELVISRARAVGATSGGGQDYNLLGDIEEEGTYRQLVAQWEGEDAAQSLREQAVATRRGGKARRTGGYLSAFDRLLGDTGSLMEKYG